MTAALASANTRFIRKYGRWTTLRRERLRMEVPVQAVSRRYKPEELIGSQQQNKLRIRILHEDVKDTPLCFPQKHDRIKDHDQLLSIENAEPIHLQEQIVAWTLEVQG